MKNKLSTAERMQLVKELIEITTELGWQIAIPATEENEEVDGLIVGQKEYVDKVTEVLEHAGFKL